MWLILQINKDNRRHIVNVYRFMETFYYLHIDFYLALEGFYKLLKKKI